MPELPEVETIRRELSSLEETTIEAVTVRDDKLVEPNPNLPEIVDGWTIRELRRRGKYLLFLAGEGFLLFSLRMTGNLAFEQPGDSDRCVEFELNDGRTLFFTTVRRFSRVHCFCTTDYDSVDKLDRLGIEPLNGEFSAGWLEEAFSGRTAPVKSLLMNQQLIAGIGNIYASEICYEAGVRPDRSVSTLDRGDLEALVDVTPAVLEKAIASRGSSISDYARPDGDEGGFQDQFRVYGRRDESCYDCGTPLEFLEISGRSSFFCPNCQS